MKIHHALLLLAVSFVLLAMYNSNSRNNNQYQQTKEEIVLRKMVHELLLSSGDSTSRILPVQQVSENEYHLVPEKPLAISPDSFVNIVNNTVKSGKLQAAITASVVRTQDKKMAYGFAASPSLVETEISCLGRNLPVDNYYISFVFSPATKFSLSIVFYLGSMLSAMAGLFLWWRKVGSRRLPVSTADEAAGRENASEKNREGCFSIGQYLFDPDKQQLQLNGEKTTLTIKETKVLQILAATPNMVVERDTLQKEVWENEGVIVTRSLDMFISKLRKKLTGDEEVKIINVHGRGYKLTVPSLQ